MEHILVLSGGTEIGAGCSDTLTEVTLTTSVNDGTDLTFGSVCAAMLEVKALCPGHSVSVSSGQSMTLYTVSGNTRTAVGTYYCTEASWATANTLHLTACDCVSLLDKDVSNTLNSASFPMSLGELMQTVLGACNLSFSGTLPMSTYLVDRFGATGVSGRQVLQWIGQVAGVYFTASGLADTVTCGWYGGSPKELTCSDIVQNSLKAEEYATAAVVGVQIRSTDADVGTVWPTDLTGEQNTYVVQANPLLTADRSTELQSVAQHLYSRLQGMTYYPCRVRVFDGSNLQVGDTVYVTDRNSIRRKTLVMQKESTGTLCTLTSTGNPTRTNTATANYRTLTDGKILELQTAVEGLRVENRDTQGKVSALELNVEQIAATVSREQTAGELTEQRVSTVEQTAEGLRMEFRRMEQNGAQKLAVSGKNYTFDTAGLRIADDSDTMVNTLDETGMEVARDGQSLLKASAQGVTARDLTAENYLIIGHGRFEEYGNGRTACYYI